MTRNTKTQKEKKSSNNWSEEKATGKNLAQKSSKPHLSSIHA